MNENPKDFRLRNSGDRYAMTVDGIYRGVVSPDKVERLLEVDQTWEPMQRRDNDPNFIRNPDLEELKQRIGSPAATEIWVNDLYQASVVHMVPDGADEAPANGEGLIHISIHRHDRFPVANWRHMQQIKNEIAGNDRWALEVYPPEEFLVDSSNEYHLWVLPVGADVPFAYHESLVLSDEQTEKYNAQRGGRYKGRQEPRQRGLTTGRNPENKLPTPEQEALMKQMTGED